MYEILANRRVFIGENSLNEVSSLLKWYNVKKPFFIIFDTNSDVFIKVKFMLEKENLDFYVYDKVKTEPDLAVINEGRDIYIKEGCDCLLAVGGGSVLDTAKAIALIANNDGDVEDYQMNTRVAEKPAAFVIAVPTTSGTGSEATKVSVVTNTKNGLKKSLYHPSMIAEVVILDAALTLDLPVFVTASTAMDALSHAVESYVSLNATPVSKMFSLKAIDIIGANIEKVCENPKDIKIRENMLVGSYLAGCALVAGIGIAHIMAQPLGALMHISHGDACSILLTPSMRLNKNFAPEKYKQVALGLGIKENGKNDDELAEEGIKRIEKIRKNINAPSSLKPYLKDSITDKIIIETVEKTTGHIKCNPRPVDSALMLEILKLSSN